MSRIAPVWWVSSIRLVGMVLSGPATGPFEGEPVRTVSPENVFYVPEKPHDSWVVGDELFVSIHFLNADQYAK